MFQPSGSAGGYCKIFFLVLLLVDFVSGSWLGLVVGCAGDVGDGFLDGLGVGTWGGLEFLSGSLLGLIVGSPLVAFLVLVVLLLDLWVSHPSPFFLHDFRHQL